MPALLKFQHEKVATANSDTVPIPREDHGTDLCVLKT
jgi:hypothetical protein